MLLELPAECVLNILKEIPVAGVVSLGCSCSALRVLVTDDAFWRDLAEAKWGSAVHELKPLADADAQQRLSSSGSDAAAGQRSDQGKKAGVGCGETAAAAAAAAAHGQGAGNITSWHHYCCKRMCLRTVRASPLSLLQESYPDPWSHITCCVLCSRTSGSATIRSCIARFFEAFPSPSACLQGCPQAMAALLHPLGLTQARLAAVRAVAQGFLGSDWQEPSEFKGCGKFVSDSWRIFCKGARDAKGVEDAKLKQYLAWAVRQQQPASDQNDAQQLAAGEAAAPSSGSKRKRATGTRSATASKGSKGRHQLHPSAATGHRTTRAQARAAEAMQGSCSSSEATCKPGGRRGAAASQQVGVSRKAKHCADAHHHHHHVTNQAIASMPSTDAGIQHSKQGRTPRLNS